MNKCKYCGKKIYDDSFFCCNQCEINYKEITRKDNRNIGYFIAGIIIGFLIMFCGVLFNNNFVIGIGIMLMGSIILLLPFTTPETIAFLGYYKSKIIGRILGILMIVVGIWVIL